MPPPPILTQAEFDARYGKRLGIVVPYRNRPRQLAAFLQRMVNYFQRDKLDRHIRYSIHVVEQQGNAPFNAGMMRNIGFRMSRENSDYTCFHDVDYLPIWADYSWSAKPARLIWHGLRLKEDPERFFGGVVLLDNAAFRRVNGYPNCYWGWGSEDLELGVRCKLLTGGFEHRDGTFLALPHKDRGHTTPGVRSEEAQKHDALFRSRRPKIGEWMVKDGLTSLDFKLVRRDPLRQDGAPVPNSFHYLVDIGKPPG